MDEPRYPRRTLPDGRVLEVYPLLGGRGRLGVGDGGSCHDDEW